MNIVINETSATETLSIIDPNTGIDYIQDFIGNTGALKDGQFTYDDDQDAYLCDQETFNWWSAVVDANQTLENRIHTLVNEHGSEAVYDIINEAGNFDLEDHAANINQVLDDAFGTEE
ncbi:MAG: hypothetical protein IBX56_14100 [Methylomicrobium sp.]|nr:hypothetical protein [Methylomicrobium sp.]